MILMMVFKLVRTDSIEPSKIRLPVGIHLLGRGKFLDCNDKRISRNHGELQVTEDAVTIKSLHQNPCFYMKKGSDDVEILKQSFSVELTNGDKFGLLPDSYWYEILHCVSIDINKSPEGSDQEVGNMNKQNESEDTNNEIYNENTEPMDGNCDSKESNENANDNEANNGSKNKNSQEPVNFDVNEIVNNEDRSESPSLLQNEQPEIQEQNIIKIELPVEQGLSPFKRCHSPENSDDDMKKLKIEPGIKQEDIKQEQDDGDARPGPSNDQVPSNSDGKKDDTNGKGDDGDLSQQQPPNRPRERCLYGANCYRRNPQHKTEFSHPSDPDWGPGERGVCPWGSSCRKRDPRHWACHDHPPGMRPPQQYRPGKKKRQGSPTVASVDDDLPAKRTRKPVKKPHWGSLDVCDEDEIDLSDDEDDPFKTDTSEDDWQPSSEDITDVQSQDDDLPDVLTQDLSPE